MASPREFHDLSEHLLNRGTEPDSYWGNLGYWQGAETYPEACRQLADKLARAAQLNEHSHILDAGFGCGDQLLHWLKHYSPASLRGVNLSHSQTQLARQRLCQAGFAEQAEALMEGDVLGYLSRQQHLPINTLLALDCAYHFADRAGFIQHAGRLLAEQKGCLAMTDLILARDDLSWREQLQLSSIARMSHIPLANLVTRDEYQQQLEQAGFQHVQIQDISDQVFLPFGQWLDSYRLALSESTHSLDWLKYRAVVRFLGWAHKRQILRYIIVSAR